MKNAILTVAVLAGFSCFAAFSTNNLARVTAAIDEAGSAKCPVLKRFSDADKIERFYSGQAKVTATMNKDKSGRVVNAMCVELMDLVARERKKNEAYEDLVAAYKHEAEVSASAIKHLQEQIAAQKKVIELLDKK